MRVLLSDGFGVTSRQVAVLLGRAGHEVAVARPAGRSAVPLPRGVVALPPVPSPGADPWAWCDGLAAALAAWPADVVLGTREQVAVLSRAPERAVGGRAGLAVPPFAALRRVMTKTAAAGTLREIGIPQPPGTVVLRNVEELRQVADPPLYVKTGVGAAVPGVFAVERRERLLRLADTLDADGVFGPGGDGVLVQRPAEGPRLMAQAVFDSGRLVAVHACVAERDGRPGGVSVRRSVVVPEVREHVALLGGHLGWHGALSLDAVLTGRGPVWTEVTPRLVEPANAAASGTDLVGALLAVSAGGSPPAVPWGREGVRTHAVARSLVTAGAAGRRAVTAELVRAVFRAGGYRGSLEELLSVRHEPRRVGTMAWLAARLLIAPRVVGAAVTARGRAHRLTEAGWRRVTAGPPPAAPAAPASAAAPAPAPAPNTIPGTTVDSAAVDGRGPSAEQ